MDPAKKAESTYQTVEEQSKPSLEELHDHLDSLWTSYLDHLEAYTSAQKTLQKHMSAGFLSLARTNFNPRDGIRRYGKDYYHERAIATRRVAISTQNEESRPLVEVVQWNPSTEESDRDSDAVVQIEKLGEKEEDVKQLPSPPRTPEPESHSSDAGTATVVSEKRPSKTPLESDPLRWFGILIPQALRTAQASFIRALDVPVADAANAAKGMRNTEAEIRKLRKEIKRAEKESSSVQA